MIKKKAFTLIELVAVIVVMGIIASIGADIVAKMYENYLRSRAISNLEQRTEVALEFIAKKLQDRVRRSTGVIRGGNIIPLSRAIESDRNIVWLGISKESQLVSGADESGWSGILDLGSPRTTGATNGSFLYSPGSKLWSGVAGEATASTIIEALSYGDVKFYTSGDKEPVLIPKYPNGVDTDIGAYYSNTNDDYTTQVIANFSGVNGLRFWITNGDNIGPVNNAVTPPVRRLYEQYYLSHTAYAIIPVFTKPVGDPNYFRDFNLTLRYNFQPWHGEDIRTNANVGRSAVIAEHVSTFRIREVDSVINIKLCIGDINRTTNFEFAACKETVVF